MQRLICFLLVLVTSVWLGVEFSQHSGYILLAYRQWVIELPLWLAVIMVLAAILILYAALKVFVFFHALNEGVLNWWRKTYPLKAYDKTQRGLLDMIEERWLYAERNLIKGVRYNENLFVNYLMAAEAAFQQKAVGPLSY